MQIPSLLFIVLPHKKSEKKDESKNYQKIQKDHLQILNKYLVQRDCIMYLNSAKFGGYQTNFLAYFIKKECSELAKRFQINLIQLVIRFHQIESSVEFAGRIKFLADFLRIENQKVRYYSQLKNFMVGQVIQINLKFRQFIRPKLANQINFMCLFKYFLKKENFVLAIIH